MSQHRHIAWLTKAAKLDGYFWELKDGACVLASQVPGNKPVKHLILKKSGDRYLACARLEFDLEGTEAESLAWLRAILEQISK